MTDQVLVKQQHGRALILTLNRPDALNAFNDALYNDVGQALRDAAEDDGIAAVALTGAGRAFSAGQDLDELGDARSHDERVADGFGPFITALESFPKPLIAAVNGLAVGIGTTLLPHCDIVLASREARFRAPFSTLGVTAEAGSSLLLVQRLGWQRAADFLLRGRWMDAQEATEHGLLLELLEPDELLPRLQDLLSELSALPVASLKATKSLMLEARLDDTRAARAREDARFGQLVGGPANQEALAAFAEKRAPNFSGL